MHARPALADARHKLGNGEERGRQRAPQVQRQAPPVARQVQKAVAVARVAVVPVWRAVQAVVPGEVEQVEGREEAQGAAEEEDCDRGLDI